MNWEEVKSIDELIRTRIIDPAGKAVPVLDGIVKDEEYAAARYKILWILKESNDTNSVNGKVGDWDTREFICDYLREYSQWRRTYNPMIYITWSILNGFCEWDDIDDTRNSPELSEVLRSIAFINLKKLPGGATCYEPALSEAYAQHKNIILKQIEAYRPDIIIAAGTWGYLLEDMKIDREKFCKEYYAYIGDSVLIGNYHPNQRSVGQQEYFEQITSTAKEWAIRFNRL